MKLVIETLYEDENLYFKGPKRENILKSIDGLPLINKFKIGIKNNIPWLVKQCISDGIDPTIYDNAYFKLACAAW